MPAEVFEEWKKKDPIDSYVQYLLSNKITNADEIAAMEKRIETELIAAREEALRSPFPPADDAMRGVYAE